MVEGRYIYYGYIERRAAPLFGRDLSPIEAAMVGWLVYSYTDPPFGMQVESQLRGSPPKHGSKLDLIGLARTPSVLKRIPPVFKNGTP